MNVIHTERLVLRHLDLNDDAFILELLNEPAFLRFIGDKGVRTLGSAREYMLKGPIDSYERHGFGLYAACLLDGTPAGICGLVKRDGLMDVDVGFAFLSRHCSKGYATESAAAVLVHARQVLRLQRIVAITSPENSDSIAVLEKIGLKFERMIRLAEHGPELKLFGPARFVRHPSYTGALMAFLGLALCLANWASLVILLVPVFLVFPRRMHVEEGALLLAFGDQYRDYMRRTKRLIPAVY